MARRWRCAAENGLTTRIFGMGEDGAVTRALMGDEIGTLVTA